MKMPEELTLREQASMGDAAEAMTRSRPYTYAMEVMKERIYRRWLEASTTQDREMYWALATAHENLDRTLKEFKERGDLAVEIANEENVGLAFNEEVPA